jgi:hypothetical protein
MKKYSEYHPEKLLAKISKPWANYVKGKAKMPDEYREFRQPNPDMFYEDIHEWYANGRNIFEISPVLFDLLQGTDISEVVFEHLHPPYENFYIQFPTTIGGVVEGVYCQFTDYKNNRNYAGHGFCVMPALHSCNVLENSELDIRIANEDYEDFDQNISNLFFDYAEREIVNWLPYVVHTQYMVFEAAINIILYLSLPTKDIAERYPTDLPIHLKNNLEKANTKRRKEVATQAIQQAGYTKIKYVGQSFSNMATGTGEGKAPHWRRGHWRKQPHGEGLKLNKLIWIMPTVINPDQGKPQKGHIYNVPS